MQTETISYHGWDNCLRLASPHTEIVVSTQFGPRILHYGLTDGPNAFALCPALSQPLPDGTEWKPYGGHRLWLAPEQRPRSYFPDNSPVGVVRMEGDTLRLSNPPEDSTGFQKEMRVTLSADSAAVRVMHSITNHTLWPVSVSAWALSIVANGGWVVLPQEPYVSHDDNLEPARPLVMWKFTEMGDPRWRWGTKYITLRQDDQPTGRPQKVGVFSTAGWAAHLTAQQAFVVHIPVVPGGPASFPDYGSSFETYTDGPFQELETLSPLQVLASGQALQHTEDWFLAPIQDLPDTDAALDARLLPIVAQARQAIAAFVS